ncbi:7189_t:CDS:2 [Entrophospora sp. SA101]|nr:7189_t:CDS:2 [Entrophospora sp. SA101]
MRLLRNSSPDEEMAISESLLDENEELNGQYLKCKICLEEPVTHCFSPRNHLVTCEKCAYKIDVMNVFVEELDLGIGWIVHYSMKHKRFDAQDACGISHASVPIAITVGAIEKSSVQLLIFQILDLYVDIKDIPLASYNVNYLVQISHLH